MILKLIRIRIAAMFSGMLRGSSKSAKRSPAMKAFIAACVVFCAWSIFMSLGMMFKQLGEAFYSMGLGWLYFALAGLAAFAVCFVGSIFMASGQLFMAKDNDLLLSMPLKSYEILGSRMGALLLMNYVYEAFIIIPAGVVWCMTAPVTVSGVIGYIAASLLLPLLAMALSCLAGWLIAEISARMKNRNILTTVLMLLFLAVYFYAYSKMAKYMTSLIANGEAIAAAVQKAIPPAYLFGAASADGDFGALLRFAIWTVLPFAAAWLILSANFMRISTTNRGAARVKYREKRARVSGVLAALTKKELRHFTSNPMYMLNAGLGLVFMPLLAILLAVKREMVLGIALAFGPNIELTSLVCAGLALCGAMNFISAPSVSLEGKSLWIVRSIPARTKDVLMAKVLCHVGVCIPVSVISSVICIFALKPTVLQALLLIFLPAVVCVFSAFLGVFMNLQFPKLDWTNEVYAVKQGAASLVTMLGTMAAVVILAAAYALLFSKAVSIETYLGLCAVLLCVPCVVIYKYLCGKGSLRFEGL